MGVIYAVNIIPHTSDVTKIIGNFPCYYNSFEHARIDALKVSVNCSEVKLIEIFRRPPLFNMIMDEMFIIDKRID